VVGSFHPPFLAHDLLFSPGGRDVWVTSADTSYVAVFSVGTRRLLFRVPAGPPPQHLVFAAGYAYITSGYGSSIEKVNLLTGRVVRRTGAPYGSFDLDAAGGYVATASLLKGTLAVYDKQLRLIRIRQLAPSTEDVALSRR
jgi:DNA-binding beta-propeller fold protein YncE